MSEEASTRGNRWRRIQQPESSSDSDEECSDKIPKSKTNRTDDDHVFKQPKVPSKNGTHTETRNKENLPSSSQQTTSSNSQKLSSDSGRRDKELAAKRKQRKKIVPSSDSEDDDTYSDFSVSRPITVREMVKNVMVYILVSQGKLPTRKSDILKVSMNKQKKDFQTVINKVAKDMLKTFGLRLIGVKNGLGGEIPVVCDITDASCYFTISIYRQERIAIVAPNQSLHTDILKAALMLILTISYMTDKEIAEDIIWNILVSMDFTNHLCKRREDFKRFLKTEYVDPLYLTKREVKDANDGPSTNLYGWGLRANVEVSKYAILKFVSQSVPGSKAEDFVSHFSKIPASEAKKINEEDEIVKKVRRMGAECELGEEIDSSNVIPTQLE